MSEEPILDDVSLVHEVRRMLWQEWGERSCPELWITDKECGVRARGTDDAEYVVTIRKSADV